MNSYRVVGLDHVQLVTYDEPLPGYQRAYVDDPFGNRLELMERAPFSQARGSCGVTW